MFDHNTMMFPRILLFTLAALLVLPCMLSGQSSVDLQQAFLDLSHDGVIMNISAHPDDEDGATLAYYRMKYGVKTYSVFFTRGEGGQNETGPELYEDLGVLRTAETLNAAKILGSEVRFLNFLDFGFSKTATEAFRKWGGRTEPLRRLVYFIRKLKPDVIFTYHNSIDGHGHHQAVAITAIDAFDAAADPAFFPEQLKEPGVTLWQPRKLFFRILDRTTADVVNDIKSVNVARNMSYFSIATEALKMHKTQGMDKVDWRQFTREQSLYKLMRSNSLYDRDTSTFFGGINFFTDEAMVEFASLRSELSKLNPGTPEDSLLHSIELLLEHVKSLRAAPNNSALANRLLDQWQEKLERLAGLICGVSVQFKCDDDVLVSKQKVNGMMEIFSDRGKISDVGSEFTLPEGWTIEKNGPFRQKKNAFVGSFALRVSDSPHLTLPKAVAQYNPIEWDQSIVVHVSWAINGSRLSLTTKEHVDVAPEQVLTVLPRTARVTEKGRTFEFILKNYLPHKTAGKVSVVAPLGWMTESSSFTVAAEDSEARGTIFVRPPRSVKDGDYKLQCKTEYALSEVTARSFAVDVAKGLTVGIVKSYDTTLEAAVEELGVSYKLLDAHDLENDDLSEFQTILVDIRAYLVREDLRKNNAHLLEYVKKGGNLVVMYQRDQEWKKEYAPYPLEMTRQRVTDEEAPVNVLHPEHPLFNTPNKIVNADWLGWKQERAVYFPTNVSPEYVQLLSSHDPDEPALSTGYLVANVGKGSYIYTSYVWYRQLKEMNPGAFRCFANMISYPQFRR